MDPITFDTLARTFSARGTRRQLVTVLAALPLVGVLTGLPADDVNAEQPRDRLQRRTAQRNRKQQNDNSKDKNQCGDMVCPSDRPFCCEVMINGNVELACVGGTCPTPPA